MAVVVVVVAAARGRGREQTHYNRVAWRGGDTSNGSRLNRRMRRKKGRKKKNHTSRSLVENNISYVLKKNKTSRRRYSGEKVETCPV